MLIRDLFVSDVTRDIPPVVYFHDQRPEQLAAEVSEYIITGGWPENHPNHKRVPSGIHEEYVRLLRGITRELHKSGGPELPAAWISGFYGSGKSSFAKLLGLALDGVTLPDGTALADTWLRRDMSPKSSELREAWEALRGQISPLAVVFDVGGVARENEQVHAVAVRQLQKRLGYCGADPHVADFELKLERDGEWGRFERAAADVLGAPWSNVKDRAMAEEDFSHVMSKMFPERYTDPMAWFLSRGGTHPSATSPEEAVAAIRDMLAFRRGGATLFFVIDEVSQYVLSHKDRVDRLRAFATALGTMLRGQAWLFALGQQKLEDEAGDSFLIWAKDRFPPSLRVHLGTTNIRDVVHRRLLQKRSAVESTLRERFERHRPDLKLYAYGCEDITPDEFVEVYPLLPGQIDLILRITSALRARSTRAQGDDQAIRGLLQLLGELFRDQNLADMPLGALVTLDEIYDVQHTALDSDVQASMARILDRCAKDDPLFVRTAKVVALLELIQDTQPTDARLVAQCLYDRLDLGNNTGAVNSALETLRARNLLGYSEKQGYKIQSSAAEEWERERREMPTGGREARSAIVQDGLRQLIADVDRPRLEGRPFPWSTRFSDGRQANDVVIQDLRDDASICVDFRFLSGEERTESTWVRRSDDGPLRNRLVWICGDTDELEDHARGLLLARAMVKKYRARRESLSAARKMLLQQEEIDLEDRESKVRTAVAATWMSGRMYFRGRPILPRELGTSFKTALEAVGQQVLPGLFPHFVATQVLPGELLQLLESDISGPSSKFLQGDLGILDVDAGRYVPACTGIVPQRVLTQIESDGGLAGANLLAHFGGPPYGYTVNVVKACVAGLLHGSRVRIQLEGGDEITAIRDAGVRDLFDKDRAFRRATVLPAGEDDIGYSVRARICTFFEESFGGTLARADHVIADAAALRFPQVVQRLRALETRLGRLGGGVSTPAVFHLLSDALEECLRNIRQTQRTVRAIKKHLDTLRDGVQRLQMYEAELTDDAIGLVAQASRVMTYEVAQLSAVGVTASNIDAAAGRIREQLDSEQPWRDIATLEGDIGEIRAAYRAERERLLRWQETEAEDARSRVRARRGFSTLSADQAHVVLRTFTEVTAATDAESIAPPLADLGDPFTVQLQRAEAKANDLLDAILSEGDRPLVSPIDLRLHNREVATEADVDALVAEVRTRLLEQVRSGRRVRLL